MCHRPYYVKIVATGSQGPGNIIHNRVYNFLLAEELLVLIEYISWETNQQ